MSAPTRLASVSVVIAALVVGLALAPGAADAGKPARPGGALRAGRGQASPLRTGAARLRSALARRASGLAARFTRAPRRTFTGTAGHFVGLSDGRWVRPGFEAIANLSPDDLGPAHQGATLAAHPRLDGTIGVESLPLYLHAVVRAFDVELGHSMGALRRTARVGADRRPLTTLEQAIVLRADGGRMRWDDGARRYEPRDTWVRRVR